MGSGKALSNREKKYIHANKDIFSAVYIAKQLSKLYPLDNGGSRDRQSVRNEARRTKYRPYRKRRRDSKGRFMKLQDKSGVG